MSVPQPTLKLCVFVAIYNVMQVITGVARGHTVKRLNYIMEKSNNLYL